MNSRFSISSLCGLLLIGLAGSASAEEKASLLVTNGKSSTSLEFMAGDTEITGIQFDFVVEKSNLKPAALAANATAAKSVCLTSVPATHQVICGKQPDGSIRAIVYSGSNAILKTGELGVLPKIDAIQIVAGSVKASDPKANKVEVQALNDNSISKLRR